MLEAKNVHKVYHTGSRQIPVLKGVNLKIEKGKFIAIVGPSGAGKSTLLHILGGLDVPAQGQVIFASLNIRLGQAVQRLEHLPVELLAPDRAPFLVCGAVADGETFQEFPAI